MTSEIWVCGDCRSVNKAREKRCYRCRVPRATAELTAEAAAISAVHTKEAQTVLARATRMGARYRPTWPLAVVIIPVILVTTWLSFAWTNALVASIGPNGETLDSRAVDALGVPLLIALFGGLLIWSTWIALVVANVPALTARQPTNSSVGAFFAQLRGFRAPYRVIWGVQAILTEGRSGPRLVVLGWWLALMSAYGAPLVVIVLRGNETLYQALVVGMQVRLWLLAIAAILAIALVVVVEREQRAALQRRASVVVGVRHSLA
jgi:hypothetical protein